MRALIMSDSHGMGIDLKWTLLQAWKQAGDGPIDWYIHCGDGCGDLDAVKDAIVARDPRACFCAVRGNCDFDTDVPAAAAIVIGGVRVFVTHGHLYHVKSGLMQLGYAAEERGCDIVLYGHTHVPDIEMGRALMINPGSAMDNRMALLDIVDGKPHARLLRL